MAEEKLKLQQVGNPTRKVGRPRKQDGDAEKHVNGRATLPWPKVIVKRDGNEEEFNPQKILIAIEKCFEDLKIKPKTSIIDLAQRLVNLVSVRFTKPTVENIQDM